MSRIFAFCIGIVWVLALGSYAWGQPAVPPRFDELPKLAKDWPPAWAALIGEIVPARPGFEKEAIAGIAAMLQGEKPTPETYRRADLVLTATLRHHESVQRGAPFVDQSALSLHAELQDQLVKTRGDWLRSETDAEALKLADRWLPVTAKDSPLRAAILQLWVRQAKAGLEKTDFALARSWLHRIEGAFQNDAAIDEIRKPMRDRAVNLLKESQTMPDAPAIRALEDAFTLWPRLPEARDTLARRKGTYRTLVIGVPSLPEQMSPATAWTEVEKQALELLFDRLYAVEWQQVLGRRYRPQLAADLPDGALTAPLPLRRDVYWSSGERLTAGDLRRTAHMMNQPESAGRSALWRDVLEVPRLEGSPFHLTIGYRQGLLDPLAPLTFHVLPQYYHGKQLERADDSTFAKAPVGSGPYQYVGRKQEAGRAFAVFQANPHDLRPPISSVREIRMSAWTDARKDLPKPLPQLILDAPTNQMPALKELGYVELRSGESPCVSYLAINHRKPSLASASVRRAIAHALDRQALLNRYFRGPALNEKYHATSNGLLPRDSWASCPAPRVPAELFDPEQARSFARKAKSDSASLNWTLKYPTGDPRVKGACEEMARTIATTFQEAGIQANVNPVGLPPHDLRKAIQERDYDLAHRSTASLDDPVQLALFFDPSPDATRAGGSNEMGYDSDVKLQELLRSALKHRQFSVAQTSMHAVHAHLYEAMPAIPLWQLDLHVLALPSLRVPALQSRPVFAQIRHYEPRP